MKNSVIYIVGATVLLGGGAYLFLKNKKAKDLSKLAEIGGTTTGGTTTGGTTSSLSTKSDGVSPSDANINLTNANNLLVKIANLKNNINRNCGMSVDCLKDKLRAKAELPIIESQLAKLGYKVDNGLLVKI